jgi:hypothetical protein
LDASGGSVFRNLLGAAKGALIRAAASTQPFARTILINAGLMRLTVSLLFAILVMGFSSLSMRAQGICVQEPLVVSSVAGRVVAQLDKGETPLHDITVKVLNRSKRVIAKAVTHDDGLFNFTRTIKPGKYVLDVSYRRLLATYRGELEVVPAAPSMPRKEIVVTLGADFVHPCGGTHAELK